MLRISKLADYATVIMSYLAQHRNVALNAVEIASAIAIPLPTVRKVLKALQAAKLLHSSRGAEGGYQLARSADNIYLGQIIEAIDGALALTECCTPTRNCSQQQHCHTKDHWQMINKVVRQALYKVDLTHLEQKKPAEVLVSVPSRGQRA